VVSGGAVGWLAMAMAFFAALCGLVWACGFGVLLSVCLSGWLAVGRSVCGLLLQTGWIVSGNGDA